jgi:hypothetical protein
MPPLNKVEAVTLAGALIVGVVLLCLVIGLVRRTSRVPNDPPPSVVRSCIAVSLVLGLLVFCAATLATADTDLQSQLFGALTTSVGAAVAFYFSSQASDKARADILASIDRSGTPPTTFTNPAPPPGVVGKPYSFQFTTDAQPPATFTITGGKPPDGLKLAADGTLAGQPGKADDYTFGVRASNVAGTLYRDEDFTVTVAAA